MWWWVWHGWIQPGRELEQLVNEVAAERVPRTFIIGGSERMRGIALALEQLALRERLLRARVQESEFGVQAIVERDGRWSGRGRPGTAHPADEPRLLRKYSRSLRRRVASPCWSRCARRRLSDC